MSDKNPFDDVAANLASAVDAKRRKQEEAQEEARKSMDEAAKRYQATIDAVRASLQRCSESIDAAAAALSSRGLSVSVVHVDKDMRRALAYQPEIHNAGSVSCEFVHYIKYGSWIVGFAVDARARDDENEAEQAYACVAHKVLATCEGFGTIRSEIKATDANNYLKIMLGKIKV